MRAVVEGIEIEGTPAEIADLLKSMRTPVRPTDEGPEEVANGEVQPENDDEDSAITEKFAYRTLKRIPLSVSQKALLLALRRASPSWVLASALQNQFEWSGTQLGGVLGGLGRRLTATKGYRNGYALWDWKWDDDEGEYAYRLPDAVVLALDRLES